MVKIAKTVAVLVVMLMLSGMASANLSPGITSGMSTLSAFEALLLGASPASVERYDTYTDAGVNVTGGTQPYIFVNTSTVDTTIVGAYYVNYSVTDSSAPTMLTTSANRTVNVVDTTAPDDITGIAVGTVTPTSVELSWTNPDTLVYPNEDFAGIVITVSTGGLPVAGYDKLTIGNVDTYTITGLAPNTAYTILLQSADDQEPNHPGDGT